jgi:hypothetical protein
MAMLFYQRNVPVSSSFSAVKINEFQPKIREKTRVAANGEL